MENALGEAQTIVLFGGSSEIGRAIVARLVSPATRTVVLAVRDPDAVVTDDLRAVGGPDLAIDVVAFDAADTDRHGDLVDGLAERHGDLDVVVIAFAVLGDQALLDDDPAAVAALAHVNFTAAITLCAAVARRFRAQGHGRLVVLSSVAGERVRKANYAYGSTKAGLDGFAQGLGDALHGTGASVLVVRPGFVHTKMTAGLPPAPFATTPAAVADATVKALRAGRRTVWVPAVLRPVFSVMRHLPAPLWRRMPR